MPRLPPRSGRYRARFRADRGLIISRNFGWADDMYKDALVVVVASQSSPATPGSTKRACRFRRRVRRLIAEEIAGESGTPSALQ